MVKSIKCKLVLQGKQFYHSSIGSLFNGRKVCVCVGGGGGGEGQLLNEFAPLRANSVL